MSRLSIGVTLAAALSVAAFAGRAEPLTAPAAGAPGLAFIFDPAAGAVRDTNGDGLPDRVAARVVVPDEAAEQDVLVAANLAGRFGFETVALTLPLVVRAGQARAGEGIELPVFVGRTNPFITDLVDRDVISLDGLGEGQGLVAIVPSPWSTGPAIAVVGGDDDGTLAAGNAFAAYAPRLWGSSGSRFGDAERQVVDYLRRRRVEAGPATLSALVVDAERRGLLSIRLRVPVATARLGDAERALAGLDLAHRRGQEAATLNFANVSKTIVELMPDAGTATLVTVRRSGLNPRALTPPDDDTGRGRAAGATGRGGRGGRGGAAPSPADESEGGAPGGGRGATTSFDLQSALTIDGWFGDSYPDLMADRVETTILIGDAAESLGAAHLAARLGLDSTGITLPLVREATDVTDPSREPSLILVGRSNSHVGALEKIGRVRFDDLGPGEGAIEVVPRAFGGVTATVVAGIDAAGTDAAATYLARRVPFLWDNARGSLGLDHLTTEVRDVFRARTSVGQAALAVAALDDIIDGLGDEKPTNVEARVFLEEANPAFDAFVQGRLAKALADVPITVTSAAISSPVPVFEERKDFEWEVDEFRSILRDQVLSVVKAGSAVRLDVRLSESPELRQELADEARAAVVAAGATSADVRVRSAYKQGFLWMAEEVVPALKGRAVASVEVRVKEHKPDFGEDFRFHTVPTRWLHELYPIDEILRREVGLPLTAFTMELVDEPADTYAVVARDRRGRVVYEDAFSPKVVEREYLDKFPGWSRVEVTTGWLAATVDGTTVVDQRIATDPERFWDYYQESVLPRIHDHVMKLTNNRPTANLQPFHRDLDVEVWMSEPDFRIGVDEEHVSALESLHEDLYFVTLDFYNALGRNTTEARLRAPGKIFPIIHPERRGQAPSSRVLYAANAAPRARVEVSYGVADAERPTRVNRDLTAIDVGEPFVRRAVVGGDGVREIEVELRPAGDEQAARAADLLDTVRALHEAALYRDALSYAHVDRLAFALSLRDARPRRVIPSTGASPPDPVHHGGSVPDAPLVTWDHVISPEESESLVARLAAFPEIAAYRAGRSYRGRDISVIEITLPTPSEQISVTKYTAYKPTIVITGRQHANEVSSTSHILRLAELLAVDPSYRAMLKRLNVVLHPVENPDGAAMAFELQKLTPTHMLHAGRYSALGQDVAGGGDLLPESRVRNDIWRLWRPDIYLNPHGYPSHEWVQQFAGYVSPQFRAYWSTRGWYTQLSGTRDPRYPQISAATDALREAIADALTADPDVRAVNLSHQDRYRRWANGFAPFVFSQEIYEDTAIYYTDPETGEPRGGRRLATPGDGPASRASMNSWPQVTFNRGMTEAPDETAQGAWLDLVTRMGFAFLGAHLDYLHDGRYELTLVEEGASQDRASRTLVRVRPVLPADRR